MPNMLRLLAILRLLITLSVCLIAVLYKKFATLGIGGGPYVKAEPSSLRESINEI